MPRTKTTVAIAGILLLITVATLAGAAMYIREELHKPYLGAPTSVVLEIPHGLRARDVVGLLEDRKVIQDRYIGLSYILYKGLRYKLQAGEYVFDRPMTPIEVITHIANGAVYLHKFTV